MFFKIGVLENLQFFKKEATAQVFFPVKFAKYFGTPFFKKHLRWLLLSFLKQKSKNENICSHEHIHSKPPVMMSFLSFESLQFYKKGTPYQMLFVKFVKFYRFSILHNTAVRLLPISSNFSDISLSLLAINLATTDRLSRTLQKERFANYSQCLSEKYLKENFTLIHKI